MSSATLLIVSTRLQDHATGEERRRLASSALLGGRSRAAGSVHARTAQLPAFKRHVRAGLLGLICIILTADHALAQQTAVEDTTPTLTLPTMPVEAGAETRIGGPPPGPCVVVDIAGHRAGHLDCATDRLQAAADTAQAQARSAIETPVIGAGSPDHQTGVANQTATRLRMGNALGNSVHPQRPNRPVHPPRGGGHP